MNHIFDHGCRYFFDLIVFVFACYINLCNQVLVYGML